MLRSSAEVSADCKKCFELPEIIAKLAVVQAEYQTAVSGVPRHSEARQSEVGKQYTYLEERILDVLELATFCRGQRDSVCGLESIGIKQKAS